MYYIKSFSEITESYLRGSRAPLYHFTHSIENIIKSDKLLAKPPAYDRHGKRNEKDKCVCVTRFPGYTGASNNARITLNTDLLIRDGYKPIPIDEVGFALVKTGKIKVKYQDYSKPNPLDIKTVHGLDSGKRMNMEIEYEERIYKDIVNLGKYIEYIDLRPNRYWEIGKEYINYIKKYPHIKVREMNYKKTNLGNSPFLEPKVVLLDFDMIKKQSKDKETVNA